MNAGEVIVPDYDKDFFLVFP